MSDKLLPIQDELSSHYWAAAREGRLEIQRCRTTGEHQFYPRAHCTVCFKCEPEWVAAKGTGTLYSFSVVNKAFNPGFTDATPYVFAIVRLDEGPHVTANIVDVAHDELECDMPVKVVFTELADDVVLPNFTVA
jgi:uncharacterized OB-fold protein